MILLASNRISAEAGLSEINIKQHILALQLCSPYMEVTLSAPLVPDAIQTVIWDLSLSTKLEPAFFSVLHHQKLQTKTRSWGRTQRYWEKQKKQAKVVRIEKKLLRDIQIPSPQSCSSWGTAGHCFSSPELFSCPAHFPMSLDGNALLSLPQPKKNVFMSNNNKGPACTRSA